MPNRPTRILAILTDQKLIAETVASSLPDLQSIVGGYIERATILPNGDEVYVNEEGLLLNPSSFFEMKGQIFAGNGYVIGEVDAVGDNNSALSTKEEIEAQINWLTKEQIQARYR